MANLEVVALDTVTPQLRAPASGDGYSMPRPLVVDGVTDIQDINITDSTISVTQTNGSLNLSSNGNGPIVLNSLWNLTATGNLAPIASNGVDVGSSTYRVRSLYAGTSISLSGTTVTTSTPMLNLSQTWNNAAITFTGISANITKTAAGASSKIMDLQLNGSSVFTVNSANTGDLFTVLNSSAVTMFGVSDTAVTVNKDLNIGDAINVVVNNTTGTKIGTATGQKLGFFNATPVVQRSTTGTTTGFTAGAGTAVLSDSTFTGSVGSTAYTIGDVVRALKELGFLAS